MLSILIPRIRLKVALGLSAGLSTAFFGLSPFFLTYLASQYFSNQDGTLNVTHFLSFLGIFAGVTHFIGFIILKFFRVPVISHPAHLEDEIVDNAIPALHPHEHLHERTPLLSEQAGPVKTITQENQTVLQLLQDGNFWLLSVSMLLLLGSVRDNICFLPTPLLISPS